MIVYILAWYYLFDKNIRDARKTISLLSNDDNTIQKLLCKFNDYLFYLAKYLNIRNVKIIDENARESNRQRRYYFINVMNVTNR